MPLPMKNTPPQIHRPRKAGWRSGLQSEVDEDMDGAWDVSMGKKGVR
jgi:hypothetical protein